MLSRLENIKLFINKQNPRYIYSILCVVIVSHFLVNHNRILIESDINKIISGRVEFCLILILILQIILINRFLQNILKNSVLFFYFNNLHYYFEIITGKTYFFSISGNSFLMLVLIFGISTVVSYLFFTIIENTSSRKPDT